MNTLYHKTLFVVTIMLLFACSKDEQPDDVQLSVTANKTQVKVGENVQFRVQHNATSLAIFTGDEGHNYDTSAYVLLDGKSETDIQNNVYRPTDPNVIPYRADFSKAQIGETKLLGGLFEVLNANNGESLMGTNAEIVSDTELNQNVLKVTSVNPDWWYEALRMNVNSKVGSDRKLTLRIKHATDVLEEPRTGVKGTAQQFRVVIRLAGIGEGETDVTFNDASVWDIFWKPSTSYTDYSLDLIRHIEAWQSATGKKMATLSYIQFLFTADWSDADGANMAYVGDYYIASASYGGISYIPFSTGKALTVSNNSGTLTYDYTYTKAGTYKVVVIGTNNGLKDYSGKGYKEENTTATADEYNYNRKTATMEIVVSD